MKCFYIIVYILFFLSFQYTSAQTDTVQTHQFTREDILNMSKEELMNLPFEQLVNIAKKLGLSMDELLNMKTTVASQIALTPRETPGIISVITNQEIKASGARDLIDVLRMVPGLNFGYDDQGVVGLQMRGNWAHEGKILLIMDGIEFNELNFYNLEFGRHFDVNQIKSIEIIRGPGSSIYGGNAELGVIKITTKQSSDINGINIYSSAGVMENAFGHWDGGVNFGKTIKDWGISAKGFMSSGNRTDQPYPYSNTSFDLSKKGAETHDVNLNLNVQHKNLTAQFIYDNYLTGYIEDTAGLSKQNFKTLAGEVKYDIKPNRKLVITPKFSVRSSTPYYTEGFYQNNVVTRYTGNVTLNYDMSKYVNMVGGTEFCYDNGKMLANTDSSYFDNGKRSVSYNTYSVFFQSIIKTSFLNFIVGGRFDLQNKFGSAFAPRVGITKLLGNFHFKALYSGAFRSPAIGNLMFDPNIKPEHTNVAEVEFGYELNSNMFLTANVFDIVIHDPIIYYNDTAIGYKSYDITGSRGLELEYRMKYTWGYATLNYSFYKVNASHATEYSPFGNSGYLVGSPSNKITLQGSLNLNNNLYVSPSFVYLGERYAAYENANTTIKPELVINLFVNYRNFLVKKMELGAGVFDLLSTKSPFIQSYRGLQHPYPGPSREFVLRLCYNFSFKDLH